MMGKGRRPWIYRWAIRRHWATVIRFPVMVITSRVSTSQESHVPTVLRACFIACQLLVGMVPVSSTRMPPSRLYCRGVIGCEGPAK